MDLQIIPFSTVAAEITAIRARQNDVSSNRTGFFNTCLHEKAEIAPIITESDKIRHIRPPWNIYMYCQWLPVVAESQRLEEYHVFRLPTPLFEDMMRCHSSWICTGKINEERVRDLAETWISSKCASQVRFALASNRQWFIRLDQNSPKDSGLVGGPVQTIRDIVKKLASSHEGGRGYEARGGGS